MSFYYHDYGYNVSRQRFVKIPQKAVVKQNILLKLELKIKHNTFLQRSASFKQHVVGVSSRFESICYDY